MKLTCLFSCSFQVQKFVFKEEDIINTFDLNNMYAECKKDKKYAAQIKEQLETDASASKGEEKKKDK